MRPGAIWAIAEVVDGRATRLSTEAATVARRLAEASGGEAEAIVVADDPAAAADELAAFVPRVVAVTARTTGDRPAASVVAARLVTLAAHGEPALFVIPATPDGRDVAGVLAARLDLGVLSNAVDVSWDPATGPVVEKTVLGGRAVTTSAFADGHGIVLLAAGAVAAEPAAGGQGRVESAMPAGETAGEAAGPAAALVTVVARAAARAVAAPLEEARVIVTGGRGVGGPEGFTLVREIADLLGGTIGATRAAVDAGWIGYDRQIGQTGRTVRPALYIALGVSGAIQHRVGMQAAETVIAVNRDPDAPFAESADLFVVGDLFAVGPALAAAVRARGS